MGRITSLSFWSSVTIVKRNSTNSTFVESSSIAKTCISFVILFLGLFQIECTLSPERLLRFPWLSSPLSCRASLIFLAIHDPLLTKAISRGVCPYGKKNNEVLFQASNWKDKFWRTKKLHWLTIQNNPDHPPKKRKKHQTLQNEITLSFFISVLAPASKSNRAATWFPDKDAQWSAVFPWNLSVLLKPALNVSNNLTGSGLEKDTHSGNCQQKETKFGQ